MLELVLILVLLICGAAIGWFTGAASGIETIPLLLAMMGGFAGTAFAYFILAVMKCARSSKASLTEHPRPVERSALGTQISFRARMANYLQIPEAKLQETDSYKSSMPFWSMVEMYGRRTSRTAQEIQVILHRIREWLRSTNCLARFSLVLLVVPHNFFKTPMSLSCG